MSKRRHLLISALLLTVYCALSAYGTDYTWTGGTGSWDEPAKWSPGGVPGIGDTVTIASGVVSLTAPAAIDALTITESGSLDGNGYALTVSQNAYMTGSGSTDSAHVVMTASGGDAVLASTLPIGMLTVDAPIGTVTLGNDLVVSGEINIVSGVLDVGGNGYQITVGGKWINTGGTFVPRTGLVAFEPATVGEVLGSTTFYDLSSSTPGTTIRFDAASTQIICGALTMNGVAGNLIYLESISPGVQWSINNDGDAESMSYVSVRDSIVLGNDITVINGADAGNNDTVSPGWNFVYPPAAVVSIGPNNPPSAKAYYRARNVVIMQLAVEAVNEDVDVDSVVITGMGTGNEKTEIQRVYLYRDEDNSGTYNAGDATLGSGRYTADDGQVAFATSGNLLISEGTTLQLLVACDLDVFTLAAFPASAMSGSSGRTYLYAGTSALTLCFVMLLGCRRRRAARAALLALLIAASAAACVLKPLIPATFRVCVEAGNDIAAHGASSREAAIVEGEFPVMGNVLTVDNVANGD